MKKLTVTETILLTLVTAKTRDRGISFRQIAAWHQKIKFGTLYTTLNELKRKGSVSKNGYGDWARFYITDLGKEKLIKAGLLRRSTNE